MGALRRPIIFNVNGNLYQASGEMYATYVLRFVMMPD